MELHGAEEAFGMRKISKNPQIKPRRTLSGFLQIFIELCESKIQLAPHTEIETPSVYMLLLLIEFFKKKTLNRKFIKI